MDRDGTQEGYDNPFNTIAERVGIPVIASGDAPRCSTSPMRLRRVASAALAALFHSHTP
jgi:imidazole glycerol phosphate synthase subunit HisF